jgi:DNA-directed RNA polymerase subunit alpha
MDKFIFPEIKTASEDQQNAVYEIEPLAPGFGNTIGNSLRRVLLSSLAGSAITEVKIEGATHEFTTIPHVKDDVLEIILNIKEIRAKNLTDEPVKLLLISDKTGDVLASDIQKNANVEILNPKHRIATLDKGGKLRIEMTVENGSGFLSTEDRKKSNEYGVISVDAVFSPVTAVDYRVENTRVGQMTNYDKLILDIKTDGIRSPKEALFDSIDILIKQFSALTEAGQKAEKSEKPSKDTADSIVSKENSDLQVESESQIDPKTKITDLDLSSRTLNALLNSGIKTIGGLRRLTKLKLSEIKGLGSKGMDEVKQIINK